VSMVFSRFVRCDVPFPARSAGGVVTAGNPTVERRGRDGAEGT
jgi:hypothetical protein